MVENQSAAREFEEQEICADADSPSGEDARISRAIGAYAGPVIVLHLFLIYQLLRIWTGLSLPEAFTTDLLIPWLWINGALLGYSAWAWRSGRLQVARGLWLRGWRLKLAIVGWLAGSFAWFAFPALSRIAARDLVGLASGW